MPIFGCANDEQYQDEKEDSSWSPFDGCEPNYINACSCCPFASSAINDSLNYKYDEDW